ncbi:hypothetical protein ACIOWK_30915 [Pseudomonas protegens]|uniref:hypothetical protein n=1 Tax=Pseudomonas protegens TaxID=380021 RepID=UPI003819B64C
MIEVKFSPVYTDRLPCIESVSVEGYAITINGSTFDFSPLEKGYELSLEAIGSSLFADKAVMSADGVLSIALLMPYDEATATDAVRFPVPLTVAADGPVDIPTNYPTQPPVTPTVEDDHGLLAKQENLH